jgi:hypothetical protein
MARGLFCRATRITDRRRERTLAANPASKQPGASKLERGAAVRVHPIVGLLGIIAWLAEILLAEPSVRAHR